MKIRKRDGTLEEVKRYKINLAIKKAFEACNEWNDDTKQAALEIATYLPLWDGISVEEIQDQVEETLMDYGYNKAAKEYILYRRDRRLQREQQDRLISAIKEKLEASNIENQNANVDEASFGGRLGEASRVVMKELALNMMSQMARENHENNEIYIHDLDSYILGDHNCLSVPLDDWLANGVKLRQCDIRPAKSVSTAFQLVAVYFQIQSLQQFGGVAATHLDWTMIPYVRLSFAKYYKDNLRHQIRYRNMPKELCEEYVEKLNSFVISRDTPIWDLFFFKSLDYDKVTSIYDNHEACRYAYDMTKKEIDQAVEGLYHNLNSLQSRSGNQLPFSSINYGTCTLPEGRLIIEALLKCSIKGIGKYHRTPIFPCGIFQYMKGVNDKFGTPNYDLFQLALESTAKRIYPNYVNVDWSVNKGYDRNDPRTYTSTMGL